MRKTIDDIKAHKSQTEPLVCLTAYTMPMAQSLAPHVDVILVGDSLGMVLYGMEDTRGVSLDMMIEHGKAVMRSKADALVVIDMPYGSYEDSDALALESARRIINETGADAVKLEGGADLSSRIEVITDAGIPVMAHIGLLPQSAPDEGGFKVKGKTDEQAAQLIKDGRAVQEAGAFSVVIEGTIEAVARDITDAIDIPTIGIGASVKCDGQILVSEDLLGLLHGHRPKFATEYACLRDDIDSAAAKFAADVRARAFPREENIYKKKKAS